MTGFMICAIVLSWLIVSLACWLGWQLLRQNGRILLRLDEVEKRLDELEFGEEAEAEGLLNAQTADPVNARPARELRPFTPGGGEDEVQQRAARFGNRSRASSRIKRDGLKSGTPAPNFCLPCLDGTELSLQHFRGRRVLLVFSDPHCGPCNALAPELEKFHRNNARAKRSPSPQGAGATLTPDPAPIGWERGTGDGIAIVMISRGEPKENRAKVREHGLTFPIVLQQRWEISRLYAMFATPLAYLIDESGVVAAEVAVGLEPIVNLMAKMRAPEPIAGSLTQSVAEARR